jgi:hypothetical protein
MARRDIPFAGILVPDDRIRTAGAASTIQETGTTTTSYQQAGPTAPGAVDLGDDVVVALAGNQAESVYLDIGRGGAPDPGRGARLRWADSSTDPLLGWSPAPWIQYATGGLYLTAARACDMIPLADGKVAVVSGAAGAATETTAYNPADDTWSHGADLPWQAVNSAGSFCLVALWQDPDDEAVYCLQADTDGAAEPRHMLVKSTDGLATWSTVAQAAWSGGTVLDKVKRARWYRLASGTHVLVLIGTAEVQVWRSTSGEDWRLVGSLTGIQATGVHLVVDVHLLPDGRLLAMYCPTANTLQVRGRLCDALTDISTAAEFTAQTFTGNVDSVFIALEETGRAWCIASLPAASAVLRSVSYTNWLADDGNGFASNGNVTHVAYPVRCVQLRGGHFLAQTLTPGGFTDPVFYRLGGWTTLEPWMVVDGLSGRDSDRLTWGARNTAKTPWEGTAASQIAPNLSTYGWGRVTAGSPTPTENTTAARRRFETAGVQLYYARSGASTDSCLAFADFRCLSGGSVLNTNVGMQVRADVGSNTFVEVEVYARPDSLRVKYAGGSTLATASVDMQEFMQVMVCIESARRVEVYYKRPYETAWTSFYQDASPTTNSPSVLDSTTTSAGIYRWGHCVASTAISEWRFAGFAASTSTASSSAKRDQWRSTQSTSVARQKVLGRPLAALGGSLGSPASYPRVSLLSVAPTAGTTATVEPAHGYPVDHLDPIASPSPRQVWRSTDTSEQVIEWYLDDTLTTADLTYYGLYLSGANFRTAQLEYWTGSTWASWVQVDLGESITYSRTGNTLQASSGSPRWLQQHEAVGGHVLLSGAVRRAVEWNATGYGSAAGTRSRIRLAGATGTDPSSGSGTLVLPRGVAASLEQVEAQRVRLRIPSQQTVAGYFELGAMAIGRVYALGSPVDFGSGQSTLIDVREDEAPGYATRSRRSPPRRRWSLAIAESNVAGIRDGVAGYLAADGAPTIGVGIEGDVAPLLEGLLAQGIDASPVLVLPAPPETEDPNHLGQTTTETRRDVLWWGRVSAVQWDNVVGEFGADELHRVATVTIEEDV